MGQYANWRTMGGGDTAPTSTADMFKNNYNNLYQDNGSGWWNNDFWKQYENAAGYKGYTDVFGTSVGDETAGYMNKALGKIREKDQNAIGNADALLNAYGSLSNDEKWDVYQNIQKARNRLVAGLTKAENDNNAEAKNSYTTMLQYVDAYNNLLGDVDKGEKSFGKSVGDWLGNGGFVREMTNTGVNALGNITGNQYAGRQQQSNSAAMAAGNNGVVNAIDFAGNTVANIGANVATGGAYGLTKSGIGLANAAANSINDANRDYYVDQSGNLVRQNQTNEQKASDIGGAALNLGLNIAGAKGIGPTLNFKGGQTIQNLIANKNYGELAKGVGKYALKEVPWAIGTSTADTAIQSIGYGDNAWKNYGDNLANNIAGDVAMDVTGAFRQGVRQKAAGENPRTELYRALATEAEQPTDTSQTGAKDLTSVFEPDANLNIQKRNKLQSIGQQLKNASKTQKYSALYDALDAKTASRAVQTGAPDALAKLGVNPENYSEAAKTSNYINKVVSDLADQSGVKVNVTDLPQRLSADNLDVLLSDTAAKKYSSIVKQITPDGSTPDEYSAGYLLRKSRELGSKAANLRGNTDDVKSLRQALTDAKYILRDIATSSLENAEITGDLTNDNIAKGLAQIGANQKIQDYYTEAVDGKAPTISDYIKRSSLFEQARDMGDQIEAEKYTRSASKAPTNPMTKIWNASGLDQPTNVLLKNTVAPIAGLGTKIAGSAVEGVGNLGAKASQAASKIKTSDGRAELKSDIAESLKANFYSGKNNPQMQLYTALNNSTKEEAKKEQADERAQEYIQQSADNVGTVSVSSTPQTALYNSMYGTTSAPNMSSADYYTTILKGAVELALEAGDANAYATLLGMYQDAVAQQEEESDTETTKLSSTQQAQLAKLDAADSAIDELEGLFEKAGGGKGPIAGNLQSIAGNWGWDSNAKTYNDMAEGLVNQIAQAVGKTDSLNTEGEVKRALKLIPQLTDDAESAKNKLEELRRMLATTKASYKSVYGVTS